MYQSKFYIPTSKNNVKDAKVVSHELLIKAGYVHQHASGIYTYLPLAVKVLDNISRVIREEVEKIGACEVKMPFLQPSEIWTLSGRWQTYGAELFRVEDRHGRNFALAPTHEEVATDILKDYLNSYKKYPLNIYQIQTKMRDERRPRFGLLRSREFIMFDGYTFNRDLESLFAEYDKYYKAYQNILERFDLEYKIVEADNGAMGGQKSHEFMVISDIGEDTICYEPNHDIAYNVEAAPVCNKYQISIEKKEGEEKINTPSITSIKELSKYLKVAEQKLLKCVAYDVNNTLVLVFVLGNREIQEVKLQKLLKVDNLSMASEQLLRKYEIEPGFIGPLGLKDDVMIIFDNEIKYQNNLICGANEKDYHLKNVNDLKGTFADIRSAVVGDLIREDGEPIKQARGIEVGHIFALGDKYTKSLSLTYLDENQKEVTPVMGSYGIGVSRILSAYIEQKHMDERFKFSKELSPFDYHLIPLDYSKNNEQKEYADNLKKELEEKGYTVLLDDRNERVGSKLNDAELIGCHRQIIIGRTFTEGILEEMNFGEKKPIKKEEIFE